MIKLKTLLIEHINDYSWLSSDGTFYPTDDHERTAKILLRQMKLSPMERDGIEYTPYEIMYRHNFLRITNILDRSNNRRDLYANNRYNTPTNYQTRALTDFAIEHEYNKVIYVKDKGEYFTIWDRSHHLE